MRFVSLLFLILTVNSCTEMSLPHKANEEDSLFGDKADSFYEPTLHGALDFRHLQTAELSAAERFHAWDFTLTDAAFLSLETQATSDGDEVDTVMYLYRQREDGRWGSYIGKNDDAGSVRSRLQQELSAGSYRLLIKGHRRASRGNFALSAYCEGQGCPSAPPAPGDCLFGATYGELLDNPAFEITSSRRITEATQLGGTEAAQLIRAVQEAYLEVGTAADAIAAVDGDEVNETRLRYRATDAGFVAYEYGAGDNSYGAVFFAASDEPAAVINDLDLYECVPRVPEAGGALGADCGGELSCEDGLVCRGISDFTGVGSCAPAVDPAGTGATCLADAACGTDLVCAGLTRTQEGICVPSWMRRTFANADWSYLADGARLERQQLAHGLATVDMDVTVRIELTHPRPSGLRVWLRNPLGSGALVFDGSAGSASITGDAVVIDTAVLGFSGDEPVNGRWTLVVNDEEDGASGNLESWQLTITSRWD